MTPPPDAQVVFFDVSGTLGAERTSSDGHRFASFTRFNGILQTLEALSAVARLGALVLDHDVDATSLEKALASQSLHPIFDPALIVVPRAREVEAFGGALDRAGLGGSPGRAVYASLDASRRALALRSGLRVAPHPALVRSVLEGDELFFVRLEAKESDPAHSWATVVEGLPVVPLHVTREPRPVLYAMAAASSLERLALVVSVIERMGTPQDVADSTLYLIHGSPDRLAGDPDLAAFISSLQSQLSFVRATPGGWVVPVPATRRLGEFHPPGAGHGHTRVLWPSPEVLQPGDGAGAFLTRMLTSAEVSQLAQLDVALYQPLADIWSGKQPMQPGGTSTFVSRHIDHADNALATQGLLATLAQICGSDHARKAPFTFEGITYYNIEADIPGASSELVIVSAHFDSTAASTKNGPYDPQNDAAPGADDDASGLAGVLAAAQVLKAMSQVATPQKTIRFVLFNAEEQGMKGSAEYASGLKGTNASLVAALQMDMIGWVGEPYPMGTFEVHGTGVDDFPTAHVKSVQTSHVVVQSAGQVSPLLTAQLYPLPNCTRDPAAGRSDHASFHYHGWPACLIAEDLFVDACQSSDVQTGNPTYHTENDLAVHYGFAADVTRSVAGAAWLLANPLPGVIASPLPPFESGDTNMIMSTPERDSRTGIEPDVGDELVPRSGPLADDTGGKGPMPKKFLVEFLADWIRDDEFRCKVLHKEQTTLLEYELTMPQIMDLLSLDKQKIIKRIVQELEIDLGIDLGTAKSAVYGGVLPLTATDVSVVPQSAPQALDLARNGLQMVMLASTAMSASTAYNEGQVHIRGTTPTVLADGDETLVVIRGQGFDAGPDVQFTQGDNVVDAEVLGISCDIDVFQRVTVKVKLDGTNQWHVRGRNPGEDWSTEVVYVTVT